MEKSYPVNHGKQLQMKLLKVSGLFILFYILLKRDRLFSQGLAAATVIAKVNGELWDLDRPFEKDSSLQLIKFDDEQG
jgi:hypothetical protein